MKTIKHILSSYTALLWALLKPLGVWGVFLVAALDASSFGLPMDVVVAGYVLQDRPRFVLYALMASAGSALGSIVLYIIGYKGGEQLLRKRVTPERFDKIHAAFEKHPFWSLMFPAMLPPPTPFKLFVLAAAVSEMKFAHFMMAIFSGRLLRFLLLGFLTIRFGPDFLRLTGNLLKDHLIWVAAFVELAVVLWALLRKGGKTKNVSVEPADGTRSDA